MASSLQHSPRWHRYAQRPALLEFSAIKSACPEGIYISLQPGNSLEWSGVFFEGPYAPAVLRFRVAFPLKYPAVAPSITFISDIFHPLVTPLTTYTYTTGSLSSDTVSAFDEERLPPGGFSLRHGFPFWFGRAQKSIVSSGASSRKFNPWDDEAKSTKAQDSPSQLPSSASIKEVLDYVKYTFEDESSLDALPLEAAGNPGAWNAWRSHRKSTLPSRTSDPYLSPTLDSRQGGRSAAGGTTRDHPPHQEEWSWEGVWQERVQKGIQSSISDAVLYGNLDKGDTMINFTEISDDLLQTIKESLTRKSSP